MTLLSLPQVWLRSGIERAPSPAIARRMAITNRIAMALFVYGFVALPLDLEAAGWRMAIFDVALFAMMPIVPALNRVVRHFEAAFWLTLCSYVLLAASLWYGGVGAGIELLCFPAVCLPAVLALSNERVWVVWSTVPLALFLAAVAFLDHPRLATTPQGGAIFWINAVSAFGLFWLCVRYFLFHVETDTRRMTLEQLALAQGSRLSAVGDMAAAVAHEVNTPLAVIRATGESWLARDRESAERVLSMVDRIGATMRSLRLLSVNGEREPGRDIPLQWVLNQVQQLCGERFRNHLIRLEFHGDESCCFHGQSIQISQLLLNLVMNAFQAVRDGDRREVRIEWGYVDGQVRIDVVDFGLGIAPELRERVFDPFFTTRPTGAGTGLGLTIARALAQANRGTLDLVASTGETRFRLTLPAAPAVAPPKVASSGSAIA